MDGFSHVADDVVGQRPRDGRLDQDGRRAGDAEGVVELLDGEVLAVATCRFEGSDLFWRETHNGEYRRGGPGTASYPSSSTSRDLRTY